MILCFEGPSAVGKTTMASQLSADHLVIPEVNLLFKREKEASRFWYYEKQVERCQLAKQARQNAILDGDIFQPLWYNWIYGFPTEFPSLSETRDFYLQNIKAGKIIFPDLYIIFQADPETLQQRKQKDQTRQRRNFEKHLQMILPQKRYFEFVKENTGICVEFIEHIQIEQSREIILNRVRTVRQQTHYDDEYHFKTILDWIARTKKPS